MVHHFNSTLEDADVHVIGIERQEKLPDFPEWSKVEDCKIQWQAKPDILDNCIASLGVSVTSVSCTIHYTYLQDEAPKSGSIHFDTTDEPWKDFTIVNSLTADNAGGVCVSSVEVDFKAKTVTVS